MKIQYPTELNKPQAKSKAQKPNGISALKKYVTIEVMIGTTTDHSQKSVALNL